MEKGSSQGIMVRLEALQGVVDIRLSWILTSLGSLTGALVALFRHAYNTGIHVWFNRSIGTKVDL